MQLRQLIVENYKGIKESTCFYFNQFACIVGKNDVGKSTILKAIDAFINDNAPCIDDKNLYNESSTIIIEARFECKDLPIIIDDAVYVTFQSEELVNENQYLCIKKMWDVSQKTIKPKIYVCRKRYENYDFEMLDEKGLIALCDRLNIETSKANGELYNNKEKRDKLREYCTHNQIVSEYFYDELPTTGQTRAKKILDAIKQHLPSFEYFRADKSLADSDTSVQKYFKEKAYTLLKSEINTLDVETAIKEKISEYLFKITEKINSIVTAEEQVYAQIDFDWSKLISTSFRCKKDDANIPLASRGDGFRRITMLSYFQMLAEEKHEGKSIIFGFEEPETFLHPTTQLQLYNSLIDLANNDYQVFVTTHSPNITAESNKDDIIFVKKNSANSYEALQGQKIDIQTIVDELGIKSDSLIFSVYDKIKCLFLVEGIDDVIAMTHAVAKYKEANMVDKTFEEAGVLVIPVGGCGAIKHWNNLKIIQKLQKPYYIFLDSDKTSEDAESKTLEQLLNLGYKKDECGVTRKREIECYIPSSYFQTLVPPIEIAYGDWDDVQKMCSIHAQAGCLGGKHVCERHFTNLSFEQLRATFCPDGKNANDEFLNIYHNVVSKIK